MNDSNTGVFLCEDVRGKMRPLWQPGAAPVLQRPDSPLPFPEQIYSHPPHGPATKWSHINRAVLVLKKMHKVMKSIYRLCLWRSPVALDLWSLNSPPKAKEQHLWSVSVQKENRYLPDQQTPLQSWQFTHVPQLRPSQNKLSWFFAIPIILEESRERTALMICCWEHPVFSYRHKAAPHVPLPPPAHADSRWGEETGSQWDQVTCPRWTSE